MTSSKLHKILAVFSLVELMLVLTTGGVASMMTQRDVQIDAKPKITKKEIPILKLHKKTESFVKKLEYQILGEGNANSLDAEIIPIDLNLLTDSRLTDDIEEGIDAEFDIIDKELGDAPDPKPKKNSTSRFRNNRQMALMYQGVYAPDSRFNPFADGVMVNMVVEMKRKKMDPLYFRVYDRGVIEHVPTRTAPGTASSRTGKQRNSGTAIGGGVVRGLTRVKRFGNAEVQVAGNTTLVRAHWLTGALDVIIDYRGTASITRVRTGMQAVQFDSLTTIDRYGAEMTEFQLISPLFDYLPYYGNRTLIQQQTTELVVRHLFSNGSFMTLLLKDSFEIASYDKIIPQFGTDDTYYSVLRYLFGSGGLNNPLKATPNREAKEVIDDQVKKSKNLEENMS